MSKTPKARIPKSKSKQKQLTLFDESEYSSAGSPAPSRAPATPLMKKVAEKAPKVKNMKKVFSDAEMAEVFKKIAESKKLDTEERVALRAKYRTIKTQVKEMEAGNKSRVIVFPSLTNGEGWYKLIDFSALYYTYRLADRMGRRVAMRKDTDHFAKGFYSASLREIEKFAEQFERLESPQLDVTEDGVYIFTLRKPLSDDEVGALRRIEEMRRDKMHNVMRPKAMSPAAFQAIIMSVRQILPRMRKLDKHYYHAIGEDMAKRLSELMATYYEFCDGIYERRAAGLKMIAIVDELIADLTVLAELQVWQFEASAMIGENLNEIKKIITKEFNLKTTEDK